jgi:hypothetical protein
MSQLSIIRVFVFNNRDFALRSKRPLCCYHELLPEKAGRRILALEAERKLGSHSPVSSVDLVQVDQMILRKKHPKCIFYFFAIKT